MPKRKNRAAPEEIPQDIRDLADRFIEAVASDPELVMLIQHFEAAEREKATAQNTAARRIEALKNKERRLAAQLGEVRSRLKAASDVRCEPS
jgi:hypothetical protein